MNNNIPLFLLAKPAANTCPRGLGKSKTPFIEQGVHSLANVIKTGYLQGETAVRDHFFQRIDARIKVLFLLFFVIIVSLKKDILSEVLIGVFVFVLMLISRLNLFRLYKRILFLGFIFGFLVALPSALNLITRGEIILPVLHLSRPYSFWIYRIPAEIGFTREGMYGVMMLTLRVVNSLSLSFLVLYTTTFPQIIKALKVLKIPDGFLMIITLTYKYIFIFARTVEDMHLAVKSRLVRPVGNAEAKRWIAGRIVFVFKKTQLRCEEIFKAMLGRGFSEDIRIYRVGKLQARDWAVGVAYSLVGMFFLWM
ncbi:MAG: energy-coupling factor transporter transmembrane component T [Deltaproteobacteria bacterium]|nr:energy-coupling factor transporter transmembrane component T [Deltaproteobacteria bacterium]